MTAIRTVLEDEVPYASPADVLTYVRNRDSFETNANGGDPSVEEIHSLLFDRSEFADNRTNRAWRTRTVEDLTRDLKLSHTQKHPRHRRRARTTSGTGRNKLRDPTRQPEPFGDVQLPHLNVRTDAADGFESAEGDALSVVAGRNREDITDDAGLESGAYYVEASRGRVKVALSEVTVTGVSSYGRLISDNATVRVSYRYGTDESTAAAGYDETANDDSEATDYARAQETPEDIRRSVAKLVAADLFQTDQYGNILPATGEEASPDDAATDLRSEAMDTLNEHRRIPGA
jgi:hypothetical protein